MSDFLRGQVSSSRLHRPSVHQFNREQGKSLSNKRNSNAEQRRLNHEMQLASLDQPAKPKAQKSAAGAGFMAAVAGKVRSLFSRKGI